MRKNRRNFGNSSTELKKSVREKLSDALELPKEITLDVPHITMVGNIDMVIENYKGVFEYSNTKIRINTATGVIKIEGDSMHIKEITSEEVSISGKLRKIEYI